MLFLNEPVNQTFNAHFALKKIDKVAKSCNLTEPENQAFYSNIVLKN